MTAVEASPSVLGLALRVSTLDSTGATVASFTYRNLVRFSFTPVYTDSADVIARNGNGIPVGTVELPPVLDTVDVVLSVCGCDPVLTKLLSGGSSAYEISAEPAGYELPGTNDDAFGVVALEIWSMALTGAKPYYRWLFPYLELSISGDRIVIDNALATEFTGRGWGNEQFGTGPVNDWVAISSRPYQYLTDSSYPT